MDRDGHPLWLGAATYDERVEISRTTGGVTHKISPDIDRERNKLVSDAIRAGMLDGYYWVDAFHRNAEGRNGGGDPYFTDRRLAVGVIDADPPHATRPRLLEHRQALADPQPIERRPRRGRLLEELQQLRRGHAEHGGRGRHVEGMGLQPVEGLGDECRVVVVIGRHQEMPPAEAGLPPRRRGGRCRGAMLEGELEPQPSQGHTPVVGL
jgi:hypothetical protein